MKSRKKKRIGPSVFERKQEKENEHADAVYLEKLDEKMRKASAKVDRTHPQWEICAGCRFFNKRGNGFFCANAVLAPNARAFGGGGKWNPTREPPPTNYACPRLFLHLSYEYGERLPDWLRSSHLNIHHGVLWRRSHGIRLDES